MSATPENGLHAITGYAGEAHTWCGPSALSSILGITYTDAVARIERVTGRKFRNTSSFNDLCRIIREAQRVILDWRVYIMRSNRRTLSRWMATRTPELRASPVLVRSGYHFVVVHGDLICDSFALEPVPFALYKGPKRTFVTHYAVIGGEVQA